VLNIVGYLVHYGQIPETSKIKS